MSLGLLDLSAIGATAFAASALFWGILYATRKTRQQPALTRSPDINDIAFLLEDNDVVDATPKAAALLGPDALARPTRDCVISALIDTFPTLDEILLNTISTPTVINAQDGTAAWINLQPIKGRIRLTVGATDGSAGGILTGIQTNRENAELTLLQDIANQAPIIMSRTDSAGRLVWANEAYLAVHDAKSKTANTLPTVPCKSLFEGITENAALGTSTTRASATKGENSAAHWYDITTYKSDAGTSQYAIDADPVVRAELAQRKFMQTLSQTFAQLSIGLAIFDRRRQLVTFNPALFDMTGLPIEFISGRPTLDSFLDRLRELRMLPEPKNYASWREQFVAIEKDSQKGAYTENWNLPDGQTFRVTGRPHPDGAFALLFEDISAEISLTRRFRSEIETGQAVIDKIDDAIVVFSNGGNLVLANAAYNSLWDNDNKSGFGQCDLRGELRKWQERCTPSRIWKNLREFNSQIGQRKPWIDTAILDDGRWISCHADPISGGMTMIRFRFQSSASATIQKLTQIDPAIRAVTR
ncbi:PAS-domain containing protein [Yoonia sp. MH D7]